MLQGLQGIACRDSPRALRCGAVWPRSAGVRLQLRQILRCKPYTGRARACQRTAAALLYRSPHPPCPHPGRCRFLRSCGLVGAGVGVLRGPMPVRLTWAWLRWFGWGWLAGISGGPFGLPAKAGLEVGERCPVLGACQGGVVERRCAGSLGIVVIFVRFS